MWSYRAREYSRSAASWLDENRRSAGMGAVLAACVLAYLLFFLESPLKSREMVILQRRAPQWNTVVFSLDRDYPLRTIEVVALTPEGRPAETVWKLRKGPDAEPLSTFAYGQPNIRGMEPQVPATPLTDGETYRLLVRAPGARGEVDFTFAEADQAQAPPRSRRGG